MRKPFSIGSVNKVSYNGGKKKVNKVTEVTNQFQDTVGDTRGIIFNIQRYSIHDGPGIRTIVFLKGCPLRCSWCSNPESQNPWPEIAHSDSLCNKCGKCIEVCPTRAISTRDGQVLIDRNLCTNCGKCFDVCVPEALKLYGKEMTAREVFREIEKDAEFYRESGGGVTASGGEPLFQPVFLAALFKLCREEGIHTAIETTGCVSLKALKTVLPVTKLVLFDFKHAYSEEHKKWTQQTNKIILRNLRFLAESGTPLILRVPLIPGFNDSNEVLQAIANLAKQYVKAPKVHLLPYHRFGMGKYGMLDRHYELESLTRQSDAELERAKEIFVSSGIETRIVG
jgi:pyruvate formate lyase activating enzyme